MTHRTPSPEDRLNAYLDALASGRSTPDASDAFADLSADPSVPVETARELHDLAVADDARQGDPPDSIWETIMHATTATAPPLSPAEQSATPSPSIRIVPIERRKRRPTRTFAWLNAVAAAVLLLGLAAGWYFSGFGPGGNGGDDGRLAALPAMQTGTPAPDTAASPVATSEADGLIVIEGTAAEARVENGVRIATLGDDGLTLPVGGEMVRFPDVISAGSIYGVPGVLHVVHEDDTEAMIDVATGDVRFELPSFISWARGIGRWQMVPTDDTLTDWTVIDMATGETRLLSELVNLPGDTAILPLSIPTVFTDSTPVLEIVPASEEDITGWQPSGQAITTFVIAGSLDRVATLPDYPTLLDNAGEPTLVSSADGDAVAYETRSGDDRIVIFDTATGEELGRYGVDAVGDNPTLAGFTSRSLSDLIVTTDDGRVLQLAPDGRQPMVLHEGLDGIDNPLLFRDGSYLYVRQVDTLLMVEMLPDGFVREVASGLVPGRFNFTTPRGNMIVTQTRVGHIMVDARTGEVVSRIKAPANIAQVADGPMWPGWFDVADEGEVVIFAIATAPMPPTAPPDAPPAAWLLSPDFPDGLEVTAPEDAGRFWLSPDGRTLYAFAREGSSGPGTVWATPLGEEPDWQVVVEDVTPIATLYSG
jgi:hypothetical protein